MPEKKAQLLTDKPHTDGNDREDREHANLQEGARGISSPDLLELTQEAGRIGFFEWQVIPDVVSLSPRFLTLCGLDRVGGRFRDWLDCIYREDRIRVSDLFDQAFEDKAARIQAEFRVQPLRAASLLWMEARNLIFYDANGRPERVVGVHVDVTERKRMVAQLRAFTETLEDRVRERTRELEAENEARKQAEESLRQAQKMEAVGQLTGGVAHDFNNLLTVIIGGLDSIGRQIALLPPSSASERIARSRNMALEGARRAASLTDRLLAFARRQPLSPQVTDINRLVSSISEMLRRTLGEMVSFETVTSGGLWSAFVDVNQLENALVNLAVNARDAMPEGGRLTIETGNCSLDESYVTDLTEPVAPGQYVMIAIADTGCGMDASTLARAIEPFFTTKDVGKGTGLGLSQVYGFVRQSAGHLKIYSEVGQGTTVKIYLPRHAGEAKSVERTRPAADAPRAIGEEVILVVEDESTLRAHTVELLIELGYRVLSAPNAAAALGILKQDMQVSLLFTDVVMPGGINGRQLADEAINLRPDLKVLFTTGYTRNAIVHHGRLDSGVDMLGKPYSFEQLAFKIRSILDKS